MAKKVLAKKVLAKKVPANKVQVKKAAAAKAKPKKAPRPVVEIASHPAPNFVTNRRASFVLWGRPPTMERPRYGRGRMYSPSATSMNELRQELQLHVRNCDLPARQLTLFKPDVKLSFQADFMLAPRRGRRPDIDNLLKCVLDTLNNSIWHDDGQVREVVMRMLTDVSPEEECTVVTVTTSKIA
jgi:Holliday junction resolvase RusA-like endonuclease